VKATNEAKASEHCKLQIENFQLPIFNQLEKTGSESSTRIASVAPCIESAVVLAPLGWAESPARNSQNNLFGFRAGHTYINGMNSDDMALVREYARSNSEQAFATLVSRHVNLVYSVALRHVRDIHLAEEITQTVFILLARKAKSLSPKTILSGWLCRTARHVSANTLRIQCNRQLREQESQMQSILNEPEHGIWDQMAPLLDEALNSLGEKEHDAVVLRFFDGKELKHVGAAMGTTEDAARMRVNRGLEKLREFFTNRGITLSAGAIAGAVSANSVQSAPAGLAATITAAALSGTAITTTAAIAATETIGMTTLQKTILVGVLAAAVGTGIYEAPQIALLRERNQKLQQQQAPLTEQIQHLTQERNDLASKLSGTGDEKDRQRLRKEQLELMSLRGRVKQLADELRRLKASGTQVQATPSSAPERTDADSILFSASLTNRVGTGQTLVAGGWSIRGMRAYLLLTPTIRKTQGIADGQPIGVQSQIIVAPENFWSQIGWADAKSDAHRSTVASVLTPEQVDTLITAVKETDGGELQTLRWRLEAMASECALGGRMPTKLEMDP